MAVLGHALALGQFVGSVGCAPERRASPRLSAVRRGPAAPQGQAGAHGTQTARRRTPPYGVAPSGPSRAAAATLVERASAAIDEGRLVDAADLLERAVAVDPSFSGSHVHLARLHLEQNEPHLALALLDKAETLAAADPESAA